MGWFKNKIRDWLSIERATGESVRIIEPMTLTGEILRNKLWYRGNPGELQQFYEQTDDRIGNTAFWAQRGSCGIYFRKVHSGLPALIVDTLSDIVCNDLFGVHFQDAASAAVWERIAEENAFAALLKTAVRQTLAEGDGAFKISFDPVVSAYPIIEFFGADRVRYEHARGRLRAVIFLTAYEKDGRRYVLEERYARETISYRLVDERDEERSLDTLAETKQLRPVLIEGGFWMAVPLLFDKSLKHEGRGKSIFENKTGVLDGLDETISQWLDALRDGRVTKYIPTNLLPRNAYNGAVLKPNSFDNRYIQTEADMRESAQSEIKIAQPDIKTEALSQSYLNFLELCLQGILSPSTLGIDVKKTDNAEAQREKEKATLYTRNRIIEVLRGTLPAVIGAAMKTWDALRGEAPLDRAIRVEFGEYANPGFEAQIETIGKGRQYGILSCETVVEQLYGDSWSSEEKAAEIERLKAEESNRRHDN